MFKRLFLALLVICLVVVGLLSQIAPAPAATQEYKALIAEKRALLQRVIDRINQLITDRERLVGQILLLQELEKAEAIKAEEEKAAALKAEEEEAKALKAEEEKVEEKVEEEITIPE